jgi:hypothetical protein
MKAFTVIFFILFAVSASGAVKQLPYDTIFYPGDKVCVYDIHKTDPLINSGNDSFKYLYRSPNGPGKSWQLRPIARKIMLRVLHPGLTVSKQPDRTGQHWYSGALVVVSGGYRIKAGEKTYTIQLGQNSLVGQLGVPWLLNWQVIHFEKARFSKKQMFSCERKYEKF